MTVPRRVKTVLCITMVARGHSKTVPLHWHDPVLAVHGSPMSAHEPSWQSHGLALKAHGSRGMLRESIKDDKAHHGSAMVSPWQLHGRHWAAPWQALGDYEPHGILIAVS